MNFNEITQSEKDFICADAVCESYNGWTTDKTKPVSNLGGARTKFLMERGFIAMTEDVFNERLSNIVPAPRKLNNIADMVVKYSPVYELLDQLLIEFFEDCEKIINNSKFPKINIIQDLIFSMQ